MERIDKRDDLIDLAEELGVRLDWHEPDEQGLDAEVHGHSFDNAGFWPHREGNFPESITEKYVVVYQEGKPVACVNLATLFAWATGYRP